MKHLYLLLVSIFLLSSCKSESDPQSENQKIAPVASNDPHVRNTEKLLQGTWINLDEKGVSLVFKNNTRIENIQGKPEGKTRYFKISDGCENDILGSKLLAKAKAKYITMQDIDMCYYIANLDNDYLDLKVIGRENIIRYKKEGSKSRNVSDKGKTELKNDI